MSEPAASSGEFELVPLPGGIYSLRSRLNGQTFHPVVGPAAEAQAVHLAGTRLVERANALAGGECTIWDVGLGAAANATAAIGALEAGYTGTGDIQLLSFDRTTAAVDFALQHADALVYPQRYSAQLRTLRDAGAVQVPLAHGATLHWRVLLADFPAALRTAADLPAPHAIFFDPYSPAVNADMWTLDVFGALHAHLRDAAPCLLTTYTRSTAVRVTLLLAGFFVGRGHSTGEKDETTIAANQLALLERPLERAWLEQKVYASTNAAPLRADPQAYTRGPIEASDFAQLHAHPQFRT